MIDFGRVTASTIGGTTPGSGNLISGNNGSGVLIDSPQAGGIVIQGNMIGTDVTGTVALGNMRASTSVDASNVQIGGVSAAARNVISGNGFAGIASPIPLRRDSNSSKAIISASISAGPNRWEIPTSGSPNGAAYTLIGGTIPGAGNVISANGANGIFDGTLLRPPPAPRM